MEIYSPTRKPVDLTTHWFNDELNRLSIWIGKAFDSLESFYFPDLSVLANPKFIRDSSNFDTDFSAAFKAKDPKYTKEHFKEWQKGLYGTYFTSNAKALVALCEYVRWSLEVSDFNKDNLQAIELRLFGSTPLKTNTPSSVRAARQVNAIQHYLLDAFATPNVVGSEFWDLNIFTFSHCLTSAALMRIHSGSGPSLSTIDEAGDFFSSKLDEHLRKSPDAGRLHPEDLPHDYLTLEAVRSLELWNIVRQSTRKSPPHIGSLRLRLHDQIAERVHETLRNQLAQSSLGSSLADPNQIAFTIALLNRLSPFTSAVLTQRGLEVLAASQTTDGAWPPGRLISRFSLGMNHVPSYNVALCLVELLNRYVDHEEITTLILGMAHKSLGFVESTFKSAKTNGSKPKEVSGWSNNHIFGDKLIESPVTASVLMFLIRYYDALHHIRQQAILKKYKATEPDANLRLNTPEAILKTAWPELLPTFRSLCDVKSMSSLQPPFDDPTDSGDLISRLDKRIIDPVRSHSYTRRPGDVRSAILLGPLGLVRRFSWER